MSPTASTRCSRSPIGSRFCATARWSAKSRSRETTPEELVSLIVGKALDKFEAAPRPRSETVRLAVSGLTVAGAGPVDFTVAQSEIVGLVGLRGAGQERVGRALFGALPHAGTILLDGEEPTLDSPATAMQAGIGLIARDRVEESRSQRPHRSARTCSSIRTRSAAASPRRFRRAPRPSRRARSASVWACAPTTRNCRSKSLSGGNQQKVIVGRWLAIGGRLLDRRRSDGRSRRRREGGNLPPDRSRARLGLGVVVVSTDFEEVAQICHRALVFSAAHRRGTRGRRAHDRAVDSRAASVAAREAA